MAYFGPSSGVLNVIPVNDGAYTVAPPSVDVGGDGDYALDLNTNILYGPKDSTQTNPWPVGTRLGGQLVWQGTWTSVSPPYSFNTGDVVSDGTNQFVCVKPHTLQFNTTGPYNPGDFVLDSATVYLCIAATSATPSALNSSNQTSSYYLTYTLAADAAGTYGASRNWAKLSSSINVDATVSVGSPTSFVLADGSITNAKLGAAAVQNANLYKVSGSEAVSTGAIRDLAVTTGKLADTSVTTGKLADSSVTTAKILDGTIATGDIAAGAITQPLLAAGAVGETNISQYLTTLGASPSAYFPTTKLVSAASTASGQHIGATGGYATNSVEDLWSDSFAHARSSQLSTMPRLLANVGGTSYTTQVPIGVRCVYTGNQASHTFTNARCFAFATGTVTQFVLAVWSSSGTLLGYTGNLTLSNSALTTGTLTAASTGSLTLTPGAVYYVGVAMVFSAAPTLMGTNVGRTPVAALAPVLSKTGSGFTSGAPGSITDVTASSGTIGAVLPWVELY